MAGRALDTPAKAMRDCRIEVRYIVKVWFSSAAEAIEIE